MRIIIDTLDHPAPSRLIAQLEAVCSVHDPDPSLAVLADPEPVR